MTYATSSRTPLTDRIAAQAARNAADAAATVESVQRYLHLPTTAQADACAHCGTENRLNGVHYSREAGDLYLCIFCCGYGAQHDDGMAALAHMGF